jgi:hypothetical protein
MVTVTYEDVVKVAPEFATLAEDVDGQTQIEDQIEFARIFVNEDKWGTGAKTVKAIAVLAAHFLKILGFGENAGGSSAAGPVTSEKVGDLQRTYQSSLGTMGTSTADRLFSETSYGRTFVLLRKTILITPMVT